MLDFTIEFMEAGRAKTLGLVKRIEKAGDSAAALEWRPGPGRAHLAWQLMHIAVTEESFACKRLHDRELQNPDLYEAYGHGSTPSDDIPPLADILDYLQQSRATVVAAIKELDGVDLSESPQQMADRGWCYADALKLLVWHEGHHQGQGHITLNLRDAAK